MLKPLSNICFSIAQHYNGWLLAIGHWRCCDTIKPMSDFKPRPGTFLPYMEYKRKLDRQQPKASPLSLLEILAGRSERSLPMFDLQAQSGMQAARYGEALKSLLDAGYIAIEGEAPEQTIRLTESGGKVVQLARPA
jgi:hypothetical protein